MVLMPKGMEKKIKPSSEAREPQIADWNIKTKQ